MITVHDPHFHQESYDAGFACGESDVVADYNFALTEIPDFEWPKDRDFYPSDVALVVAAMAQRIKELESEVEGCENDLQESGER